MKTKLTAYLVVFAMLFGILNVDFNIRAASNVAITSYGGSMECAYVTWDQYEGATDYAVYIKKSSENDSQYKLVDNSLIRKYKSNYRVDVLGLTAGSYNIKVVPYDGNNINESAASVTPEIQVVSHVREGFAFSKNSPNGGNASGGYKADGTPAGGANILYVSAANVNDIKLDVITSSGGDKTSCTGLAAIMAARKKGYDNSPLIIRIIGHISADNVSGLNSNSYLEIKNCKSITIEGVGNDAALKGWGILIRQSENIEVRNLAVMLFADDGISIDTSNRNIWIHNNDFMYGTAGSESDKAKGDGSCDVKKDSSYVTISYNHFWDSGKCSLCGVGESVEYFVTYHHNWFDHSDSRHPRIRLATVHIYNNYFDGNSKYGVGATSGCSAFVEANVFRNCKYPMLISQQGSDSGTFSGDEGGMIKAYNNLVNGAASLVYHTQNNSFDAYLANSKNEVVPASYITSSGGNAYNNFDTNQNIMYSYNPHNPTDVAANVETYAGRMYGGDFEWEFNDANDDKADALNEGLMAKVKNYTSELIAVGGVSSQNVPVVTAPPGNDNEQQPPTDSNTPTAVPNAPTAAPGQQVQSVRSHNFTTQGKESDFLQIDGNLSDSKGTVVYKDLMLTTCLKIESSTSIKFTSYEGESLVLVFGADGANIKVDGEKKTYSNGIFTMELTPGEHVITKADKANLYYLELRNNKTIQGPSTTPGGNKPSSDGKTPTLDNIPQTPSYVVGDYIYKIISTEKKTAMLYRPVSKKIKRANIKATVVISGIKFKVTTIDKKAFKNCKSLKKLTIGKNVKKIGKKAFFKCKKLKSIAIKGSKLKKVGKSAFRNTNKSVKIKANKKKLKTYRKLLKKAGLK